MGCAASKNSQERLLKELITEAVNQYAASGAPKDVRKFLAEHFAAAPYAEPSVSISKWREDAQGAIGIVRLDGPKYSAKEYTKKAVQGDLASSRSFEDGCDVFYERVEGYTFTACKYGMSDPSAAAPVMEKEGVLDIRAPPGDAAHLFVPNQRGGAANEPRPRKPSRTENLLEADH